MNNSSRTGELNVQGDGEFESDDVGFTVYKGHPYCEACHVRLRLPKCKKCKKSIRDHEQAVEALGGKWCWGCFVCAVRTSSLILCVISRSFTRVISYRAAKCRLKILRSSREETGRSARDVLTLCSGTKFRTFGAAFCILLISTNIFHCAGPVPPEGTLYGGYMRRKVWSTMLVSLHCTAHWARAKTILGLI